MLVSTLLEGKGRVVRTIKPRATVANAVAELRRLEIGALVVSNDGVTIDGIVSERDVVRRLDDFGAEVLAEPVDAVMSTHVHTCSLDDDLESLMQLMTDRRIRHVPVLEAGKLAGLISIGDVVKSRIDELQRDRDQLVDYIQAR